MFILKQIPEDFIVIEDCILKKSEGNYYYFSLKKTNMTTNHALGIISEKLHIPVKDISYAGNKDRHAVTTQNISIKSFKDLSNFSVKEQNLTFNFICKGSEPISLGDLSSNYFEITVRGIISLPKINDYFPNYFDEQRFSKNNALIGSYLIKKDFKQASDLLKENSHPDFEKNILRNPSNYVTAINSIPRKILLIYLHSYQSLLFNKLLDDHILKNYKCSKINFSFGELHFTDKHDDKEFPLLGFDSSPDKEIISLLQKENLVLRDFIIRQLPNLSLEGDVRKAFVKAENIKVSDLQEDELNMGKKKCIISFSLPPGSYATIFIKSLFA